MIDFTLQRQIPALTESRAPSLHFQLSLVSKSASLEQVPLSEKYSKEMIQLCAACEAAQSCNTDEGINTRAWITG